MEIYRACRHYPGYSVSNLGKVRKDSNQAILSPFLQEGYPRVNIWQGKRRTKVFIHVLVAMEFVPRRDVEHIQVNHLNCVRDDARAVNLEWTTPKQNIAHQLLSKFVKWEDKPLLEHESVTCPYCLHDFEGMDCLRCSHRQSTPGNNYRRNAGGGFF